MEIYLAFSFLGLIVGGLLYIYLSIYFNKKDYVKKVKKYRKIQLLKFEIKNRKKRRDS